jgi:integrase
MRMILTETADRFHFTPSFHNIKPLKIQKTNVDPFTLEEIQLLLNTVRPDYKDYFTVRFFIGMRTAEIDGLKWRFVDFERRQILVRETWVKGYVEYTKTDGSQREVEMSQLVYDALKRQYEATGDEEFVFSTLSDAPLSNNNVTKWVWYPLLAHLDLRPRRPYQTRHTAATLWLANGESPEWIARQMGHSNAEMLCRVYSRYVPNLTRHDGSAFERLLSLNFSIDGGDHE